MNYHRFFGKNAFLQKLQKMQKKEPKKYLICIFIKTGLISAKLVTKMISG
jgi:hypothetical protein